MKKKMNWAYETLRLIPVDIGGTDFKSLKVSLKALKNGDVLGIFPEGTRSRDGKIKEEIHTGVAYLAIKADVPIVTAAIKGSFAAFPPGRSKPYSKPITITFGPVIEPPPKATKENVNKLSDDVMVAIRKMFKEMPERN